MKFYASINGKFSRVEAETKEEAAALAFQQFNGGDLALLVVHVRSGRPVGRPEVVLL